MSDFMKELAKIGKDLVKQANEPVDQLIQSSTLNPNYTVEEVVGNSDATISSDKMFNYIESLENRVKELEETIARLTESKQEPKRKKVFQEGTTATNPITGEKIVFTKGEWWNIDAK